MSPHQEGPFLQNLSEVHPTSPPVYSHHMRLLPPDWSEAAEAARIAEEEPTNSEWDEYDVAFFIICVLEQRELTDGDLSSTELLSMEPLDYDVFCISGSPFYEDNSGPDPPPCSTLGDCLLRRAASLGRVESAAMLLDLGARMDFAPSVLEYEGCLGTPLVNACVAGRLCACCSSAARKLAHGRAAATFTRSTKTLPSAWIGRRCMRLALGAAWRWYSCWWSSVQTPIL